MSQETKDVTSGVVTTIGDNDLVMVAGADGWKPIAFYNFINSMKTIDNTFKETNLEILNGNWVRIARVFNSFLGILCITHLYSAGAPAPLCVALGGFSASAQNIYVSPIMGSDSFTAIRFVKDGESSACFVDVLFSKPSTSRITFTLSNEVNFTLFDASIPTNPNSNSILKTVNLPSGSLWGGVNQRFTISYNLHSDDCGKGGAHEPDFGAGRRTEECADGVLSFGTLDALCEFIGNTPENLECLSLSNDHNMHQRGRSSHRLVKNCNFHNESSIRYKWKRRISSDNGLRWSSQDTDFFPIYVRSLPICSEIRLKRRRSKQHVGSLVSTGVRNLEARKEVAA